MTETSLYRRHRPRSFDQVVGQEHVVRTLRNAVERDRVHHAYLFVGSRGTGKTSVAKILARSLNCVNGPTVTPCDECESCRSIAAGTSLDVIEMDAASNRSVDDIRELRERVGYVPATGRSKVYILDEAHMLTREAWNAFLKTLEEPPPSTVFVLATTEPHKVMPTIVDRCQRFDFRRPSAEEIATVVRGVAEIEGIKVEPDAVGAISRAAQGSFRDALGTLDQLVAYGGDVLATDDVLAVLGIADADLIFGAAEAIATQDGRAAIETVDALSRSGRDPVRFARDVIAHLRQLLVVRSTEEVPESFGLVAAHSARLAEQAGRLGEVALVRAIDALSAALAGIREGDDARMALELALLRSARPEIDPSRDALAQRLERIERTLGQAGLAAPGPAGEITIEREQAETDPGPSEAGAEPDGQPDAAASHTGGTGTSVQDEAPGGVGAQPDGGSGQEVESAVGNAPAVAAAVAERLGPKTGAVGTAESQSESTESGERASDAAASVPADLDQIVALWPAVAEQLRESGSELLSTVVEAARPVSLDAESGALEVGFPPSAQFNKRKVEMKANRELFTDALRVVAGLTLRPTFVLLEEEHSSSESENGDGPLSEEEERALIAQVKSAFDAEEYEPDEQGTDAASSDGDATSAAVDAAAPEGDATASDADTAAPEGGAASSDAEGAR
jgi:DNA polymerase-3 subunit gamma/tau